jgi:uncharacterized protein
MLIRFRVENFTSFKEMVELSMIASSERIHPNHVRRGKSRNDVKLLRAATIYGANAAGKSNLTKAIQFARRLVVYGTKVDEGIAVQPFRLDKELLGKPSRFEFEFKVAGVMYEYGFEVDSQRVQKEWLLTLTKNSESELFTRTTAEGDSVSVEFGSFSNKLKKDDRLFLQFVGKSTRSNQLFLTECAESNVNQFRPAYDWFKKSLTLIHPTTDYGALEGRLNKDHTFKEFFCEVLRAAGTGISSIETEEVDLDEIEGIPNQMLKSLNDEMSKANDDRSLLFVKGSNGIRLALLKKDHKVRALKLTTIHGSPEQDNVTSFAVHEESDGTQRLFDLIPLLYELVTGDKEKVYIIDEVGRSLHPHLSHLIMKMHLESGNESNSQLIVTTHETNLLDLDFLRRDQIWFIEKNSQGASTLYSLSDFQPRYDKDIRRDYLIGRYGAIPFIGNVSRLRLAPSTS